MMDRFITNDCYGNSVACSEERWSNHIIVNHPEMNGKESSVRATLNNPKAVVTQSEDRKVFYDNSATSAKPPIFTAVTVQYTNSETGTSAGSVITAFVTKKMKDTDYENIDLRRI